MAQKKQKGVLIIDIGSASVGAGFARYTKEGIVLERVTQKPIGVGSEETRNNLEREMLATLEELLKAYEGAYEDVRVVVAAPWEHAAIRTIKMKGEKPATISMRHIENLIERYKNEKPPASGNVDIEAAAVQIRINDYPTTLENPVTGTYTAINLYESEMSATLHRAITGKVEAYVKPTKITFYTLPLIASASLRAITDETSFIFADVGGEVTEFGIMYRDALYFLASIPSGYWTMLRDFGDGTVGDAHSRLALWAKGELSDSEQKTVEAQLEKACHAWLSELEKTLKEAGATVPFPRTLFLMSAPEPARWIPKACERWGTMNLGVTPITPPMIQQHLSLGEGALFDTFLALEAIFFHIGSDSVLGEPTP